MEKLENRKNDHIKLAFQSQTIASHRDQRFQYEPMLSGHPTEGPGPLKILGKELKVPLWISSMTGGTRMSGTINRNLARACAEFGMGMGLGSCRIILEDPGFLDDFNMRPIMGPELPLWANLGIAQVEELLRKKESDKAAALVETLNADGLIIHVNPLQEWFQPEGDVLAKAPIDTISAFLGLFNYPVIVKETGQGMGPESLRRLMQLPLQAIEFGAFGGTNFARLELLRADQSVQELQEPLVNVGQDALSMLEVVNTLAGSRDILCREIIISGGIRNFLDGYYLIQRSVLPAIYGMASAYLAHAMEGYDALRNFVEAQIRGLRFAQAYLRPVYEQ
jgi:isopentenyl-diphosphate delta-isomerase